MTANSKAGKLHCPLVRCYLHSYSQENHPCFSLKVPARWERQHDPVSNCGFPRLNAGSLALQRQSHVSRSKALTGHKLPLGILPLPLLSISTQATTIRNKDFIIHSFMSSDLPSFWTLRLKRSPKFYGQALSKSESFSGSNLKKVYIWNFTFNHSTFWSPISPLMTFVC